MAADTQSELAEFQRFISARLESGQEDLSPEEALDLWRAAHPASADFIESVRAIGQAIADMEQGDEGIPIEQFDQQFRANRPFDVSS